MRRPLKRASTSPDLGRNTGNESPTRKRSPNLRHGRNLSGQQTDTPEELIRVVARVRPALQGEDADGVETLQESSSVRLSNGRDEKLFAFDAVLDSRTEGGSQAAVFDHVGKDLMESARRSFNVCIFAYGHTGSGKTYTMLGEGASMQGEAGGLLPRCIQHLLQAESGGLRCSCEFYEVYNEQIRDLLSPEHGEKRKRTIHAHPQHGVSIDGLSRSVVDSLEEVLGLVHFGNQIRAVSATTMNERSSRSHAIFTFRFEQSASQQAQSQNEAPSAPFHSTVTFVDLAGRENHGSGGDKDICRERCFINTSLFHLSHLITKLSERQVTKDTLMDFRNSKLTLLLSQALAGSSRTALIVTIPPCRSNFSQSVSALSFASTAKKIRTQAVANKSSQAVIAELEAEVRQLRKDLSTSTNKATEKELALTDAKALITHYKQSWEEAVKQSAKGEKRRQELAASWGLRRASKDPAAVMKSPFLVKLSDDPALQGCLNYILDEPLMIGSEGCSCDIVLHGVGIDPKMCVVRQADSGGVEIELLGLPSKDAPGSSSSNLGPGVGIMAPRVMLRGRPLTAECPVQPVRHGDSIILGYSHGFRLVVPAVDVGSSDTGIIARKMLPNQLDMASAADGCSDSTTANQKDLTRYVHHLSTSLPRAAVEKFLAAVQKVQPLVEEANVITKEMYGSDWARFELHVVSNFLNASAVACAPELVVCVMQQFSPISKLRSTVNSVKNLLRSQKDKSPGGNKGSSTMSRKMSTRFLLGSERNPLTYEMGIDEHMKIGGQKHLLYVWSLEKFLSRLHDIRDLYQEGADAQDGFQAVLQRLSTKRYLDPWRELTLADGRELAEGKAEVGSRSTCFADDMSVASLSSRHSTAITGEASSPMAKQNMILQPKMRSNELPEAQDVLVSEKKWQNVEQDNFHVGVTMSATASSEPVEPAPEVACNTSASTPIHVERPAVPDLASRDRSGGADARSVSPCPQGYQACTPPVRQLVDNGAETDTPSRSPSPFVRLHMRLGAPLSQGASCPVNVVPGMRVRVASASPLRHGPAEPAVAQARCTSSSSFEPGSRRQPRQSVHVLRSASTPHLRGRSSESAALPRGSRSVPKPKSSPVVLAPVARHVSWVGADGRQYLAEEVEVPELLLVKRRYAARVREISGVPKHDQAA